MNKEEISVAYGSLYMDKGEKLPKAEGQIRRVSAKKPYAWFFDIICTPNQIPEARRYAAAIYGYTGKYCPEVDDSKVTIAITTKESERPARTIMNRLAQEYNGQLTQGLDLKSGRRFLWIAGEPQHEVKEAESED